MTATTFVYTTGAVQTYTVPAGINLLSVVCVAAQSPDGVYKGGYAYCDVQVTPGQVINIALAGSIGGSETIGAYVSFTDNISWFIRAISGNSGAIGNAQLSAARGAIAPMLATAGGNTGPNASVTITPKNNVTYSTTGTTNNFVVPAGVSSVTIECQSGTGSGPYLGGYAKADLAVSAGQTLVAVTANGVFGNSIVSRLGVKYIESTPAGGDSYEGYSPGNGFVYAGTTNTTVQSNASTIYKITLTYETVASATTPVSTTRSATWDVAAKVSTTRTALWNVQQTLTQVSTTRTALWDVLTDVFTTRSALWDVASKVSTTRTALWDVLTDIFTTRSASWDVAAKVSTTRTVLWDVLSDVFTTRSALWDVRTDISTTRAALWDVLSDVFTTRSAFWDVRTDISTMRSVLWNVKEEVSTLRSALWEVLTSVGTTREVLYDVRSGTFITRQALWDVSEDVSIDRSVLWNVSERVSIVREITYLVYSDFIPHNVTITVALLPRRWSAELPERRWKGKLL